MGEAVRSLRIVCVCVSLSAGSLAYAGEQPGEEIPLRWPALSNRGFPFPLSVEAGGTASVEFRGNYLHRVEAIRCECDDVTAKLTSVGPLEIHAELEAAADAAPGPRFFYAEGPDGTSNRVMIRVTRWESVPEQEPNDGLDQAQEVPSNSLVEGRILTVHDSDMFRFEAKAGERLAFTGLSGRNGVFGHVSLILLDSDGKELDHNLSRFGTDPYLDYTFARDGSYVITVVPRRFSDFYTVVQDDSKIRWQYQLAIGRAPLLWSLFPMGGMRGTRVEAELRADYLPAGAQPKLTGEGVAAEISPLDDPCGCRYRLVLDIAEDAELGTRYLTFPDPSGTLTPLAFAVSDVPEIVESEPNNGLDQGQPLELPVIVNGRIDSPGDGDHFLFTVDQYDEVAFHVDAHALGSAMTDPNLTLARPDGQLVSGADDRCPAGASQCSQFFASVGRKERFDSKFWHYFQEGNPNDAAAAGDYILQLIDNSKSGGEGHAYRLFLRNKKPGFRLGVSSDRITAPLGGVAEIPVTVAMEEGWESQIQVTAKDLPAGLVAEPLTLGFGQEKGALKIRHDESALPAGEKGWLRFPIEVVAKAEIDGERVEVEAERPLFFTEHGAGYNEPEAGPILLTLVEHSRFSLDVDVPFRGYRLDLAKDGAVEILIKVKRAAGFDASLDIAGLLLPEGLSVACAAEERDGQIKVVIRGDVEKAEPGGHALVLMASAEVDGKKYQEITGGIGLQVK